MKKHLLVIDDDQDDLDLFGLAVSLIESEECACSYANSGIQGLQLLSTVKPDLILVDYNMPGMNGIDCLGKIKANELLRKIPVVLYSTSISSELERQALTLGAKICIRKPHSLRGLADVISQLLATLPHAV